VGVGEVLGVGLNLVEGFNVVTEAERGLLRALRGGGTAVCSGKGGGDVFLELAQRARLVQAGEECG